MRDSNSESFKSELTSLPAARLTTHLNLRPFKRSFIYFLQITILFKNIKVKVKLSLEQVS